jgi:hypothetical protein
VENAFIKNLKLDHWSTIVFAIGIIFTVTALKSTEIQVISNLDLLVISIGVSLLGLGEKLNHEWTTHIVPANIYTTGGCTLQGEGYLRKMTFLGVILDLAGVILIGYRLYCIFKQTYHQYA